RPPHRTCRSRPDPWKGPSSSAGPHSARWSSRRGTGREPERISPPQPGGRTPSGCARRGPTTPAARSWPDHALLPGRPDSRGRFRRRWGTRYRACWLLGRWLSTSLRGAGPAARKYSHVTVVLNRPFALTLARVGEATDFAPHRPARAREVGAPAFTATLLPAIERHHMEAVNRQYRLAARPVGLPKPSDWDYCSHPVPVPGPEEV